MVVMRVAVIGGGIVGAAAAHVLSGRGVSVTVVDGSYEGQATRAGAGIVCPWVDHPDDEDWYRLTREGARRYPRLMAELSAESGYARVGALLVAEDPGDLEPVRALLKRRHAEAPEMGEVTSVAAPSSLFPPLAEDLCALLVPGAARVDGRAVRDALLRAAVRQGAEVVTGTAGLTPDGQVLVRDVREHPHSSFGEGIIGRTAAPSSLEQDLLRGHGAGQDRTHVALAHAEGEQQGLQLPERGEAHLLVAVADPHAEDRSAAALVVDLIEVVAPQHVDAVHRRVAADHDLLDRAGPGVVPVVDVHAVRARNLDPTALQPR